MKASRLLNETAMNGEPVQSTNKRMSGEKFQGSQNLPLLPRLLVHFTARESGKVKALDDCLCVCVSTFKVTCIK